MDSRRRPVARGGGVWGSEDPPPLGQRLHRVQYKGPHFYQMRPPPPPPLLGVRSTFPPNKTPPWEILATGLRRGMNAYMCGGKHGRQSHATSRIRLTHVHRTVLDGHVLGALAYIFQQCRTDTLL